MKRDEERKKKREREKSAIVRERRVSNLIAVARRNLALAANEALFCCEVTLNRVLFLFLSVRDFLAASSWGFGGPWLCRSRAVSA